MTNAPGESDPIVGAVKAWREFLQSTPPNVPRKIESLLRRNDAMGQVAYWYLPTVRIQLHCAVDDGSRWFDGPERLVCGETWNYKFLSFKCRDCGTHPKTFAVLVRRDNANSAHVEVMKLGEYPPFSSPVSKRVEELLDKGDRELYRKGSRAEAQGLGIGAASYFRRIVEGQWKLFVSEMRDAAKQLGVKDLAVYEEALQQTQFSAAVRLLKDAIPGKLMILDGENPLTLLHQPLSVQLHELTDEECLQQAADIRLVLTALLENIADVLKDRDELKKAAARLKTPRS